VAKVAIRDLQCGGKQIASFEHSNYLCKR